jgi:hypothetical protein
MPDSPPIPPVDRENEQEITGVLEHQQHKHLARCRNQFGIGSMDNQLLRGFVTDMPISWRNPHITSGPARLTPNTSSRAAARRRVWPFIKRSIPFYEMSPPAPTHLAG